MGGQHGWQLPQNGLNAFAIGPIQLMDSGFKAIIATPVQRFLSGVVATFPDRFSPAPTGKEDVLLLAKTDRLGCPKRCGCHPPATAVALNCPKATAVGVGGPSLVGQIAPARQMLLDEGLQGGIECNLYQP